MQKEPHVLAGPIFNREALTLPRSGRHYLTRACYVALFCVLLYTAGQATFGFQEVRSLSALSRFGGLLFQIFCFVQLTLVMFFALVFAAGSVAQEKDRRTLILLLMTDLRNRELVLGKVGASLLAVGVLLAASLPMLVVPTLFGGVTVTQVLCAFGVTLATAVVCGSWATLVAYWRQRTFQILAVSVLGAILFLGVTEAFAWLPAPLSLLSVLSPYRVMLRIVNPLTGGGDIGGMVALSLGSMAALSAVSVGLWVATGARLRVWNPSRLVFAAAKEDESASEAESRAKHRSVSGNPVLWREIKTYAYGRKVVLIKLAYLLFAGVLGWVVFGSGAPPDTASDARVLGMLSPTGAAFLLVSLLSLILINSQGVTALTTEKDGQTLELLLVTDVTPKEFVYGKLAGVLYNSKELIAAPLVFVGLLLATGRCGVEDAVFLTLNFGTLSVFAAMLGLHMGLSQGSSRAAIASSLGTIFFLFVGIFIFMLLLIEARSSFLVQLPGFLIFIGMGSVGLYVALTQRNASTALALSAAVLPFGTFYAITSFLLGESAALTVVIIASYGLTVAAMLVPAVSEFDVALGRASADGRR